MKKRIDPERLAHFTLGVWHPLALPADRQNRAGFEALEIGDYPCNIDRRLRQQAIDAVRQFEAALDGIGCDFTSLSGPLHHKIYLDLPLREGAKAAAAIAQAARRLGLAYLNFESDALILPPPSSESEKPVHAHPPRALLTEQPAQVTFGPWTIQAYGRCKNFVLGRSHAYPIEAMAAFGSLGVDSEKESEIQYHGKSPVELHIYRGWFYLVGSIETGRPNDARDRCFHRFGAGFEAGVGVRDKYALAGECARAQ